jgi:6-phosphogluconolactonase (cycloisomerase 2 family)
VLTINGSGSFPVGANGTFSFSTALPSGSAYKVTVPTQPSNPVENCTVANGVGTVTSADITDVTILCESVGRFLYASTIDNLGTAKVWAYSIDATSGMLAAVVGSPYYSAGAFPGAMNLGSSGRYLYAAYGDSSGGGAPGNIVVAFAINTVTGALTPVPGSPFATGSANPFSLAVDPSDRFVYVVDQYDSTVVAFAIDASTGALTPIPGSSTGPAPVSRRLVTVEPSGKFLYVSSGNESTISAYAIDGATGALKTIQGSPFTTTQGPVGIAVHPGGSFLYTANLDLKSVSAFSIDTSTGALTSVPGSPFVTSGENPWSIVFGAQGTFAYAPAAVNISANPAGVVAAFAVSSKTGALVPITGSPFPASADPESITIDPSGKFAYVANFSGNTISGYAIDATTGSLAALATPATALAASYTTSITIVK